MKIVIISGRSASGKPIALQALEDLRGVPGVEQVDLRGSIGQ